MRRIGLVQTKIAGNKLRTVSLNSNDDCFFRLLLLRRWILERTLQHNGAARRIVIDDPSDRSFGPLALVFWIDPEASGPEQWSSTSCNE